ncbi:MAG: N-acyl homoserine lactonase family protein [Halobacteria archaeon]
MVDASIDVVYRGGLRCDRNYLVEGGTLASQSNPNPDSEFVDIPVYSLVIDHPDGVVLWDTGHHGDALELWPEEIADAFYPYDCGEHGLETDLEREGWSVSDIDTVFISHLHPDHAGGIHVFDGTDVPVYVHEEEMKFGYYSVKTPEGVGDDSYLLDDFDYDLNWRIIHGERETLFEDVEFIHLPGHTPGMTGTLVHLDSGSVLFAGDELYLEENYVGGTPIGGALTWDSGDWRESLQRVEELERRHDAEVVFGHDPEQFEEIESGW